MSDEAGKTRRNLVVLSSALVTVAFLKVPLQGNLIGAIDLGKVDAKHAWQSALFALCYFAVRYLLDPSNRKKLKGWLNNALAEQPRHVDLYLHSVHASKTWDHWTIDSGNPAPGLTAKLMLMHDSDYRAWHYVPGARSATANAHWEESVLKDDGSTFQRRSTSFKVTQHVPWRIYALSWMTALRRTLKVDWQFTEYVLPIGWALSAIAICIYQIWTAPDTPFLSPCLCT